MENGHWPAVQQVFSQLPDSSGNYLEIGVGNGYGISYLAGHQFKEGQCVGLDISPEMAALTRTRTAHLPNVHIESGDFLQWESPDHMAYDIIFSMEVFYYFPSIQAGLNKAVSHLKPGGQLWLMVNYYEEHIESHTWPEELNTTMQLWNRDQYKKGFIQAGLSNVKQSCIKIKSGDTGTLLTTGIKR